MTEAGVMKDLVEKFLAQSGTGSLKKVGYIKSYRDLQVVIGFGQGRPAAVPWIGFLHKTQKPRGGIYPVLLYFKTHDILILAYGIGAGWPAKIKWNLHARVKTIGQYMADNDLPSSKYDESFVYRIYEPKKINWDYLESDINTIIDEYQRTIL